jgi:hypothetical protein
MSVGMGVRTVRYVYTADSHGVWEQAMWAQVDDGDERPCMIAPAELALQVGRHVDTACSYCRGRSCRR